MLPSTRNKPVHALVQAIFKEKPPALSDVKIDTSINNVPTVTVTFHLTPELVKAWGDECTAG